jgi:hypothetical protein
LRSIEGPLAEGLNFKFFQVLIERTGIGFYQVTGKLNINFCLAPFVFCFLFTQTFDKDFLKLQASAAACLGVLNKMAAAVV